MNNWEFVTYINKRYARCAKCSSMFNAEHIDDSEKENFDTFDCISKKCNGVQKKCDTCNKIILPDGYCYTCKVVKA